MDIIWHGHSCFTIKGKDATVVTDPYEGLGNKLPKLKAEIVMLGDQLAAKKGKVAEVEGEPKVLDWPGEFEVSGVGIEAFSAKRHAKDDDPEGENAVIFIMVVDDIKICHLSGLSHELTDDLLEHIGDVDVLLLPVGGGAVLDGKTAQSVLESVEPRVVIPMYFADGDSDLEIGGAADFLKAVGKTDLQPEAKFNIRGRGSLPEDNMQFVLLENK